MSTNKNKTIRSWKAFSLLLKFHLNIIQCGFSLGGGERVCGKRLNTQSPPPLKLKRLNLISSKTNYLYFWFSRQASIQAIIFSDCLGTPLLTRPRKDYNPLEVPDGSGTYELSEIIALISSVCSIQFNPVYKALCKCPWPIMTRRRVGGFPGCWEITQSSSQWFVWKVLLVS